ncbi:MAG: hypothetical protein HQM00_02460 [Magnetococcales bacterium]|nr:hypothetical protein [Magnetococcales bacterium]
MNHRLSRLRNGLIGLFFLGSVLLPAWYQSSKPRVWILHSYDKNYSWVKDVNIGIHRVLDGHPELTVNWYYLDTKRHPSSEFKINAGVSMRRMIQAAAPDLLIAIDDDAQQYVTRHLLDHPTLRIVFAGVNNQPCDYGFDQAGNVTGILERLPLSALRETLLTLADYSGLKKRPITIRFLGDLSETVRGDEKNFRNFDMKPIQVADSRLVETFDAWQQAVLESAGEVDFLITSNYRKIRRSAESDELVPARELIDWTERHSPVPMIGTNGFFAEDGGMLAIGTSPFEQGEVAARLALELIRSGESPNQMPLRSTGQFVVAMRTSWLQARHLRLPQVYEAAARSINKYYE